MQSKAAHSNKGVTLIEALIAAVIVSILALGGLVYQYLGATHFRVAHAELTATRVGQLLIEDWKGSGAPDIDNYDATTLGVGFEKPIDGDNSYYAITVDGLKMHLWLTYEDIDVDDFAGVTLRQISVKIQWRKDFRSADVETDDPSIVLTTYARLGED
jgi:prepilin-type N-terminal cleavage/methylation domain-containing protein